MSTGKVITGEPQYFKAAIDKRVRELLSDAPEKGKSSTTTVALENTILSMQHLWIDPRHYLQTNTLVLPS